MDEDHTQPKSRILILSSAVTDYPVEINNELVAKLNARFGSEISFQWSNYQSLGIELDTSSLRVFLLESAEDLETFDFVYFRSYFRNSEQAATIAEYLSEKNVPFLCSELKSYLALSKLTQAARLSRVGLPIPKTIFYPSDKYEQYYDQLVSSIGSPFIFKAIDGATGRDNYLVTDKNQLTGILKDSGDLLFIAQKFIPNSSDLRVLVINNKVELVIKRARQDNSTHLNNTSQGAEATLVENSQLEAAHHDMAIKAAAAMHREVAGVDLMFDDNSGQPYILEVNASPQIGSGAFVDQKVEAYGNFLKNMLK
jgi:RimK family alpha-L-glutamate ligase